MKHPGTALFLLVLGQFLFTGNLTAQDMPDYLYEEWRKSAYPSSSEVVDMNPAALLWPSVKHWEGRDVTYRIHVSQDKGFSPENTRTELTRCCFWNPCSKLASGTWYWKYDIIGEDGSIRTEGPFSFIVDKNAPGVESPDAAAFAANIPETHPRVMNYGRDLAEIRKSAQTHPLYKSIISRSDKILSQEIYEGPVLSDSPAEARIYKQKGMKEVENYHALLQSYILTGKKNLLKNLLERTEVLLSWPTDDLLGSKVLSALALGFDVLYDDLPQKTKARILGNIDRQFHEGLAKWPGVVEGRHVENHFWQMEIAGNFTAAAVALGHIDSAEQMLAYTYGLFIARFPNLARQDGGWAEGEGYYSVNQTAVVDMALLVSKLGKADLFSMGWYQALPDYFLYFSPAASQVSGFGDQNDRVESGSLKGKSEMLVMASEKGDGKALYRLFESLKPVGSFYGEPLPDNYWKKPLSEVEPWYQIVNDIRLSPDQVQVPENLPSDKVFDGVGIAAMHSDVLEPQEDAAVFFRSSPFGAKGHMHANQNSFNISRKGERVFYSTGYYTSFSDPHSLTSYRHSRAHNTVLVDGIGQAFGHEGYGWIKRHLEGQHLSYVCGDASYAYKDMTDEQFLGFLEEHKISHDQANGFGDPGLKKFERHLVFARPDIVVVYDVLEADHPVGWQLLLHTCAPSVMKDGELQVQTLRSSAKADVFGSCALRATHTSRFHSPAVDFKKKYKNGVPEQYHASWTNTDKTEGMRFLTIIRLGDRGAELLPLEQLSPESWKAGEVKVSACMDPAGPVSLHVEYDGESLDLQPDRTEIRGSRGTAVSVDRLPEGNYAWNVNRNVK